MTNPPFIADLERLEDEIDEALLHCPRPDVCRTEASAVASEKRN